MIGQKALRISGTRPGHPAVRHASFELEEWNESGIGGSIKAGQGNARRSPAGDCRSLVGLSRPKEPRSASVSEKDCQSRACGARRRSLCDRRGGPRDVCAAHAMRLRWDAQALTGLDVIYGFKRTFGRVAARSFVVQIAEVTGRLLTLPMSGQQGGKKGLRFFAVPGAPYIIVYRVRDETVDILTMIYTGDDWGSWFRGWYDGADFD